MAVGAAAWFVFLQIVVIGAFCPWCCVTHAFAVAASVFVWRDRRDAPATWRGHGFAAATATLALGALILVQSLTPEAPTTVSGAVATSRVVSDPSGKRLLTLHGGRFTLDPAAFPVLGDPSADQLVVAIGDYTCAHCRHLHQSLERVQSSIGDRLGVVMLPGVRGEASEAIHRLMLTLYREDPAAQAKLASRLHTGEDSPTASDVRSAVAKALGPKELDQVMARHRAAIDSQLRLTKSILAANKEAVDTSNLPQLLIGDEVLVGAAKDDAAYYAILNDKLDLKRAHAPRLQLASDRVDLGEVSAGVGREVALSFTNIGEQTAVMSGLRMPRHWRVVQAPPQQVAPGAAAEIKFIAATPQEDGPWEKEIALVSNGEPAEALFTVSANVRKLITVEPPMIEFSPEDVAASKARTVRITLAEPVTVGEPSSSPGDVSASLQALTESREYELTVVPKATLNNGQRRGIILPLSPSTEASDLWPSALQVPYVVTPSSVDAASGQLSASTN